LPALKSRRPDAVAGIVSTKENGMADAKRFRVKAGGGFSSGGPRKFWVEVYAPAPRTMPWKPVDREVFGSYAAAQEHARDLYRAHGQCPGCGVFEGDYGCVGPCAGEPVQA
jgi:hypothetical protein